MSRQKQFHEIAAINVIALCRDRWIERERVKREREGRYLADNIGSPNELGIIIINQRLPLAIKPSNLTHKPRLDPQYPF